MLKKILILIAVATFTLSISSCREKSTGEKVEDAVEDVADDIEDTVD
ncbi:hypothetical protein I5168_07060 [Nonlabens sp. SCSIO 43208]